LCDQECFELRDDILSEAPGAVAYAETEVTDPVALRLELVEMAVVEVGQAKATELPLAHVLGTLLRPVL
jgi:hypothetical protein